MSAERPFLVPFLAFSFGLYLSDSFHILLPIGAVAACFCCLALACLVPDSRLVALVTPLFFLACGLYALTPWNAPVAGVFLSSVPVPIEGVIVSRPAVAEQGGSLVLRVDRASVDGGPLLTAAFKMQVFIATGDVRLARGDRIRISTRVTVPVPFGLPGEFDYARHLAHQGIAAIGRLQSSEEIVLLRQNAAPSFLRHFDHAAQYLGELIRKGEEDRDAAAVLCALLLGDQKRISEPLAEAYTRAGVNHILSVSGFHVGIIAFFLVQTLLLFLTRIEALALACNLRRTVFLMALPVMFAYLLLTGAAPATARSVVMLAALVLAFYAERETDPVNTLLFSAMLLLSLHPPGLFDLSFQLSFLAMWGIVVFVPRFMEPFGSIGHGSLRTLLQFAATSCAASLVTLIPVLFLFQQASFNGLLANFLIVPLLGYGAVLAGFCALPLALVFPPACQAFLWVAGLLVKGGNALVHLFARLPVLDFPGVTAVDMLLFLITLLLFTLVRPGSLRTTICCTVPLCAVGLHLASPSPGDGRLRLTMLSVGQAESLLIRLPDSSVMLVDGGGYLYETDRDFGKRVLAPALRSLGVHRIDRLVLTHPHPDHGGGMPYLVRNLEIGEFWVAGTDRVIPPDLRSALLSSAVTVKSLEAGARIGLGPGVHAEVLAPFSRSGSGLETDRNDSSLVLRIVHGKVSLLLTGDAGEHVEEELLRRRVPLGATLLKVGHHGSRHATSDDFLDTVAPRVALISAGRENRFGLPSREVLERLRRRGVRVFRTDIDGTIDFVSDGNVWSVSTFFRRE